jgi:flavin-dependent dehydrogenase
MYHGGTRPLAMARYDVGIVGAGPTGTWAASLLARRGVRVALVDPSHPREKPCGGGVTGRALALVADAVGATPLPAVRITRARFVDTTSRSAAVVPLRDDGTSLVVASRQAFDARLLAAARRDGAAFIAARVVDVARTSRGFVLHLVDGSTCEIDRVVGADGANSLTRRRLAVPFRRDQLSVATGFFVQGVTSTEAVVEFVGDPPGYAWSFPRPDHLAVGICAPADADITSGALRDWVSSWISSSGLAAVDAPRQAYAWPIPSLSARDLRDITLAGDGWFLAGDAAGLVDPITREGIFFALQSARHLADAITAGGPDPARDFVERVQHDIVAELIRAADFKARFFQPRFTRLLVGALQRSHRIRRIMADLVAGAQPYRGLSWRLAGTLEGGLAWRLLKAGWLPE